jgi:phosphomannomutase/phosphoglucomutase
VIPPREIFKAYDIRGLVDKTLTAAGVEAIGQAIGSAARARGLTRIAIGRDGRLSGPALSAALSAGIRRSGVDVVDVGMVTTPMLYFAAHELTQSSGVMVTGSHNPPDYNGLKMVLGGDTLSGDAILSLHERLLKGNLATGQGQSSTADIAERYMERVVGGVSLARPMKVVLDCGNGIPGRFAPALFRRLGCTVVELFCDVDGHFPNHHPDPSQPENLKDLQAALARGQGEIGLAFDGDGDRLGVVTRSGHVIFPDRQLMLFAADVLSRNPGAEIIFDVKCTRNLFRWILDHGGKPTLWKTGHSLIKARMKETGALLAGEMSGHTFFKERWYGFDDGLYAGARLLEILSRVADVEGALDGLPDAVTTPELQIRLSEGENFAVIAELQRTGQFEGARDIITLDGVRVEYADGFGLARSSNTTPVVVMRFEADTQEALERIQQDFKRQILKIKPDAVLPY